MLALGIDGGGTHTRCLVINEHGKVIGRGDSGPSKPDAVEPETSRANLQRAIRAACETCKVEVIETVFIGMGGVVSEADKTVVLGMIKGLGWQPNTAIGLDHDVRVALAGGTAGQPGVALIVGTGSSCYGRNAAGESWRCGGWGYILDDVGSGFYLGQQAIMAVVRGVDGRAPTTALQTPIMQALGLHDPNEIMHRIYHPRLDHMGIAGLAPIVVELATSDPAAGAIIERGCAELAELVSITAQRLHLPEDVIVVPVGSLATESAFYRAALERAIGAALPAAQVRAALVSPVAGAALLALQQVGISLTEMAFAKLQHDSVVV